MQGPIKSKWTKIKMKLNNTADKALESTHNHYLCFLPAAIGFLSSYLLKLFFSGININETQISIVKNIPKDGVIVYVTKYKSTFGYYFYHTRHRQENLPVPEIGFDYKLFFWQPVSRIFRIFFAHLDHFFRNLAFPDPYTSGYIKEELINGRSALLSLVEKKGFYRRFVKDKEDPVQYLIEIQQSIDRPVYLVPQLIFFGKEPHRSIPTIVDMLFGSGERPGILRRLFTLFRKPGTVFAEISEPLNLKVFLDLENVRERNIEQKTQVLRRYLLTQINHHRQGITGPILKSPEELKESILTNERLQTFMKKYSDSRDVPLQKIHKEADTYIEEIAAKYNILLIKMYDKLLSWILNSLFEGVTVNKEGLNKVKNMSQKGRPLILIPCHRSHIDYLILSYLLYNNNMPCPLVAAGKNLSFWPMGPLFRGGGAFFIRRTFSGAVLYSKVFSGYIYKILEEGFNIEFFIEGGRSRTGKMILPKLGLLSILINAYKEGACDDLVFVPIYIGYDRVLEEGSYLNELEGGQKEPESIFQVIRARKFLKRRYGKIYLKFHEPISLREVVVQEGTSLEEMTSKQQNALCRNLGHRVINAINNVAVVTPHGLVASAVLNSDKHRFSYEKLMYRVETYLTYLFSQKVELSETLILNQVNAVEHALDSYVQRKFIERISEEKGEQNTDTQFMVNENKRLSLEYYKNNCIAHFVSAAFTSLAILEKDAFQFSTSDLHATYTFLQDFFKYEFAYDIQKTPEYHVRKNIKAFIDDAIIMPHPALPDTYNLTSEGFRKLKLFSSFLKTYFESSWVVLDFFKKHPQNSVKPKERLKKNESTGIRMYKSKEIERKEALSKINFQNAADLFAFHGIKGEANNDKIEFYSDTIQRYLSLL
ncbi:1-acyl-sn-glycerol-3-phosphate acyltransferase [Thermodesulfobacteriota bacterium]